MARQLAFGLLTAVVVVGWALLARGQDGGERERGREGGFLNGVAAAAEDQGRPPSGPVTISVGVGVFTDSEGPVAVGLLGSLNRDDGRGGWYVSLNPEAAGRQTMLISPDQAGTVASEVRWAAQRAGEVEEDRRHGQTAAMTVRVEAGRVVLKQDVREDESDGEVIANEMTVDPGNAGLLVDLLEEGGANAVWLMRRTNRIPLARP